MKKNGEFEKAESYYKKAAKIRYRYVLRNSINVLLQYKQGKRDKKV